MTFEHSGKNIIFSQMSKRNFVIPTIVFLLFCANPILKTDSGINEYIVFIRFLTE